jgi:hypothetical protein
MNRSWNPAKIRLFWRIEGGDLARDLLLILAEAGGQGRGDSLRPQLTREPAIRC